MAKEIVIQQTDAAGDLWIYKDDQRRFVHIRQTPSDWVEVEPENVPRLISALCELSGVCLLCGNSPIKNGLCSRSPDCPYNLSGVSGVPTEEEIDAIIRINKTMRNEGAAKREGAKWMRSITYPLIVGLRAANGILADDILQKNDAISRLQAENEDLKKKFERMKMEIAEKLVKLVVGIDEKLNTLQGATEGAFAEWASDKGWFHTKGGVWHHSVSRKENHRPTAS